jgi:hypothetical protein
MNQRRIRRLSRTNSRNLMDTTLPQYDGNKKGFSLSYLFHFPFLAGYGFHVSSVEMF